MADLNNLSFMTVFNDFNAAFLAYQKCRTDTSLNSLNRLLSLFKSRRSIAELSLQSLDQNQFLVNLYRLITSLDAKSDLTWSCVYVLEIAPKDVIVKFKFVPLLSRILLKVDHKDKLIRLLVLIQDLSYNIRITSPEFYLDGLIDLLVEKVYGNDAKLAQLSLSVLTNLCFRNPPVICLLVRNVKSSEFVKRLKSFGVLGSKMFLVTENAFDYPDETELHFFIKQSFLQMGDLIKEMNEFSLRHLVEIFTDSKMSEGLKIAVQSYTDFRDDIQTLLTKLDSQIYVNGHEHFDGMSSKYQTCYGLLLEFLDIILNIDTKNLPSLYLPIVSFSAKWMDSEKSSAYALNILATIVKLESLRNPESSSDVVMTIFKILQPKLVLLFANSSSSNSQTIALLGLIIVLIRNQSTQELMRNELNIRLFEEILMPLLKFDFDSQSCTQMSDDGLLKYIVCLQTMTELAAVDPENLVKPLSDVFANKQIQICIAKALLSQTEQYGSIVLNLAKSSSFPVQSVAKVLNEIRPLSTTESNFAKHNVNMNESTSYSFLDYNRPYLGKNLEEPINETIEQINNYMTTDGEDKSITTDMVKLLGYRITVLTNREKDLTERLMGVCTENSNLTHHLTLVNSEIAEHQGLNIKMQILLEKLQGDARQNERTISSLKESFEQSNKSLISEKSKLKGLQATIIRMEATEAQNKKDLALLRDRLKESLKMFEEDKKVFQNTLEEREKELAKSKKTNQDLNEKNVKLESMVSSLEEQMVQKNSEIERLQNQFEKLAEGMRNLLSGKPF